MIKVIKISSIVGCFLCCITIVFFSCAKKQIVQEPVPEQHNNLVLEYEKEGFIDNNTFRVIMIVPAEEEYDELSVKQKGQERAFVSLKHYIISKKKIYDEKVHGYLITTISEFGTLKKRESISPSRYCYYFDITKSGLKKEIDALGQ